MRVRTTRWLGGIAAAAALTVALAGCGGGAGGASNASLVTGSTSAASVAPASSPVYIAVDTDLNSGQWKQADALLSRFPDKAKLLSHLQQAIEKDTGASWQSDIKPALGDQIDVVFFGALSRSNPDVVALVQPKDDAAFARFVKKADAQDPTSKTAVADYKGWKVISGSQAAIDRFEAAANAGPALADDATYKEATASLSGEALATVYANGAKVTASLQRALPQADTSGQSGKLAWAVADLVADSDGVRLDGAAKTEGMKSTPTPAKAELLDRIPAGALAVISFNGETFKNALPQLQQALQTGVGAAGGSSLPQLQSLLPLFRQLGAVFAHENALYVRSGLGPIPEVTLVTQPDDPAAAAASVQQAVSMLGAAGLKPRPLTIGSVHAEELNLGQISIYYGADEGRFVVTTSQQAFADLRGGGAKLSGDATFKEAMSTSGMPDATDGFLYLNLKDSIPLVEALAQLAGQKIPQSVSSNLAPLRTAVAWATNDGPVGKFSVFLEIK